MKKTVSLLLALFLAVCLTAAAVADPVIDTIMAAGTTQAFTDEPVSEDDLTLILQAGLSAASAINQQPWYFVAITDRETMSQLGGSGFGAPGGAAPAGMPAGMPDGAAPAGMPEGAPAGFEGVPDGGVPAGMPSSSGAKAALGDSPAAIIIYMDTATKSPNASFDCGLAAQNMYIAAAALGYGVKIVSSPTMTLNGANHDALCEQLGVDSSMEAVAVLLIGYPESSVDIATGATTRDAFDAKVSVIR